MTLPSKKVARQPSAKFAKELSQLFGYLFVMAELYVATLSKPRKRGPGIVRTAYCAA